MLSSIWLAACAFLTTSRRLRQATLSLLFSETVPSRRAVAPRSTRVAAESAELGNLQKHQPSEAFSRQREAHLKDFSRSQRFVRHQRSLVPHLLSLRDKWALTNCHQTSSSYSLVFCDARTGRSLMMRAGSTNVSVLTEDWFVPALSTGGEAAFYK